MDVVDLFRETGTVDELGIAAIRDSFSDLFFPGTSTIQTRACYFLLLPWTYLRMERKRIPSSRAEAWARDEEFNLNARLLTEEDTAGVFGSAAGRTLKRLPSAAYWGGLWSWGIRLYPGSTDAYLRSLDGFYQQSARKVMESDAEGRQDVPPNWHPHVPKPPDRFPDTLSVALRREDAEYLCDRILARHPGSLLAVLVSRPSAEALAAGWPWDLATLPGVSPLLREQLDHARRFAVALHGAALLYNLMLAELREDGGLIETYRGKLNRWAGDAEVLLEELHTWDLETVWAVVRGQGRSIGLPTRAFVASWVETLRAGGPLAVTSDRSPARQLVQERETQLKGARARLASRRHLELWGGASGTDRLGYRWSGTRVILKDIFDGLSRTEIDARNA
jgi:hypothetical protein